MAWRDDHQRMLAEAPRQHPQPARIAGEQQVVLRP